MPVDLISNDPGRGRGRRRRFRDYCRRRCGCRRWSCRHGARLGYCARRVRRVRPAASQTHYEAQRSQRREGSAPQSAMTSHGSASRVLLALAAGCSKRYYARFGGIVPCAGRRSDQIRLAGSERTESRRTPAFRERGGAFGWFACDRSHAARSVGHRAWIPASAGMTSLESPRARVRASDVANGPMCCLAAARARRRGGRGRWGGRPG